MIVALINNRLSIKKKKNLKKPVHALAYKMLIKSKECIRNRRKKHTANAVLVVSLNKGNYHFSFILPLVTAV